jgi:hypothetical protein
MDIRTHFVDTFSPNQADLNFLADFIRSEGVPCTTDVLLHHLLQWKLMKAQGRSGSLDIEQLPPDTVIYQMAGDYEVGQRIYIASRGQMAVVKYKKSDQYATTPNGLRTVWHPCQFIRVRLEDGTVKQFICAAPFLAPASPAESDLGNLIEHHGKQLRDELKKYLWHDADRRFVSFEREWFLRDLLVANDEDTAQEVIELLLEQGTPASVLEIAHILFEDVSDPVLTFSLGVLLNSRSNLFRSVRKSPPPALWFVHDRYTTKVDKPRRRAVPSVRRKIIDSDPRVLKSEERGKPRKKTKARRRQRIEFAIPIGYRESGTIPLNDKTAGVFPSGLGDIPLVFVDARGDLRMKGGVAYEEGYAWGILDWLEKYGIPAGGMTVLERTENEFELKIDYVPAPHAQTYSVRVVEVANGQLVAYTRQITPPCEVDPAMYEYSTIFECPRALWAEATDAIFDIICCIFPVLAEGDPDDAVHYKAISSAVSYIRRCGPNTVWALLSMHECFQQVEGRPGFWFLDRDKVVGLEETEIVCNALFPKIITLDNGVRTLQTKLSILEGQVRDQAIRLQAMGVV